MSKCKHWGLPGVYLDRECPYCEPEPDVYVGETEGHGWLISRDCSDCGVDHLNGPNVVAPLCLRCATIACKKA